MKTATLLALLGVASAAHHDDEAEFAQWQAVHGRNYKTLEERNFRLGQFARAKAFVSAHNRDSSNGHKVDLNNFADWTEDEYSRLLGFGGLRGRGSGGGGGGKTKPAPSPTPDPSTFPTPYDWRTLGSVTAVRNQGSCGSCWAFAAAACMESMWHIKTGATVNLSEQ